MKITKRKFMFKIKDYNYIFQEYLFTPDKLVTATCGDEEDYCGNMEEKTTFWS